MILSPKVDMQELKPKSDDGSIQPSKLLFHSFD